ncbi:hypothetical protein CJF32_00006775 [Rutstroemia sp. NJR-2017a WRK4]|nr:hypothetical protein CJF32_00006775 [Rutstroemia sp. NJR-2017a WRK4]
MQFSTIAAASAFAAVVAANGNHSTTATPSAVWVTDVVTSFTTVCPVATSFSFNGVTYTATESETVTITNCPCTVSKPVYTTSSVICSTCTGAPTTATVIPSSAPVYPNGTVATSATSVATSKGSVGTTSAAGSSATPSGTTPIISNSGNRVLAFSGASLAGLLGVAAYIL